MEKLIIYAFICHLIGDYLLQNDWMAANKTKAFLPAWIHAGVYSMPFAFIVPSELAVLVIFLSHFLIDRYRLAQYWIRLVNWYWSGDNFGYAEDKPKWMSVWLLIIVDNTLHIIINTLAILYL